MLAVPYGRHYRKLSEGPADTVPCTLDLPLLQVEEERSDILPHNHDLIACFREPADMADQGTLHDLVYRRRVLRCEAFPAVAGNEHRRSWRGGSEERDYC